MNRSFIFSVCILVFAVISGGCDSTNKTDNQVPALESSEADSSDNQAQTEKAIKRFGKESVDRFEQMFQTGKFDFGFRSYGNLKLVKWLVEKGADISSKDKDRKSVLDSAGRSRNQKLIDWLKAHGAKE